MRPCDRGDVVGARQRRGGTAPPRRPISQAPGTLVTVTAVAASPGEAEAGVLNASFLGRRGLRRGIGRVGRCPGRAANPRFARRRRRAAAPTRCAVPANRGAARAPCIGGWPARSRLLIRPTRGPPGNSGLDLGVQHRRRAHHPGGGHASAEARHHHRLVVLSTSGAGSQKRSRRAPLSQCGDLQAGKPRPCDQNRRSLVGRRADWNAANGFLDDLAGQCGLRSSARARAVDHRPPSGLLTAARSDQNQGIGGHATTTTAAIDGSARTP